MQAKSTCSTRRGTASMQRCQNRALTVVCSANASRITWKHIAAAGAAAITVNLLASQMAFAEFRLPPIDRDPNRCDRGFVGNTIGQANAVSDKLLDLRQCSFKGANLQAKVLAGALMSEADFTDANMQEAVLTKAYARNVDLSGADLTNGVIDRVDFTDAVLKGAKLRNAVVTGTIFAGADLTDVDFEDALIGSEDVKRLCENPTLVGESRYQVGCRK